MKTRIFYTDGACSGNPGPGSWAVAELEQTKDGYICHYWHQESETHTTNNRMELEAIIHVMKLAAADQDSIFEVHSDSSYSVNSINTWIHNWAKNNWKNTKHRTVENVDLMRQIYKLLHQVGFNFKLYKISGHSGKVGNELVDAIASKNKIKRETLEKKYNIQYPQFEF